MAQSTGFATVTDPSTTWAELKLQGIGGIIEDILATQAATDAPTSAPTATATGGGASGGLLANGTYYIVFTETNGLGETTISPQSSQLTVAAGNIPRVTFPALKTGNTARHLYLGAVGGASGGPYTRYASYITTNTHDCAVATLTTTDNPAPPTINSTGLSWTDGNSVVRNEAIELARGWNRGNGQNIKKYVDDVLTAYLRGEPVSFAMVESRILTANFAARILERATSYAAELVRQNPGSLVNVLLANGQIQRRRTWP